MNVIRKYDNEESKSIKRQRERGVCTYTHFHHELASNKCKWVSLPPPPLRLMFSFLFLRCGILIKIMWTKRKYPTKLCNSMLNYLKFPSSLHVCVRASVCVCAKKVKKGNRKRAHMLVLSIGVIPGEEEQASLPKDNRINCIIDTCLHFFPTFAVTLTWKLWVHRV